MMKSTKDEKQDMVKYLINELNKNGISNQLEEFDSLHISYEMNNQGKPINVSVRENISTELKGKIKAIIEISPLKNTQGHHDLIIPLH